MQQEISKINIKKNQNTHSHNIHDARTQNWEACTTQAKKDETSKEKALQHECKTFETTSEGTNSQIGNKKEDMENVP